MASRRRCDRLVRVAVLAGCAVAALLACGGCRSSRADPAARPVPPRPSTGETIVRRADVEDVFLLTGELQAVASTSIVTPRAEGELQIRWMAEDGSEVKEGDRVVEFDGGSLIRSMEDRRLRVRQAENDFESRERTAVAEREKRRVAVEKATIERDKARIDAAVPRDLQPAVDWQKKQNALHEQEAALEKARLEEAAYAVTARSDVEVARLTLEKARRELESGERMLSEMSAVAPRSGIVLVGNFWQWGPEGPRKLQPGDTVWPGYPIASIPDPSRMEVGATLPEVDRGRVTQGMRARCVLDTYPDRVFEGRIEEVGAVAADLSGRSRPPGARPGFPVRVSLDRVDPLMRPGLSARVEAVRRSWKHGLAIPRQAVRFDGSDPTVQRQGSRHLDRIALAGCTPTECVVQSGLKEGDRVLLF